MKIRKETEQQNQQIRCNVSKCGHGVGIYYHVNRVTQEHIHGNNGCYEGLTTCRSRRKCDYYYTGTTNRYH